LWESVNTTPIEVELTRQERTELTRRARSQKMAHRDVLRAKIILMLAEGQSVSAIARQVLKQRKIVRKWGERFVKKRLEGLCDEPGRGRVPLFSPDRGNSANQARVRAA
jgi:restriction endonuclease Mrr